jgi:hypothetical protein
VVVAVAEPEAIAARGSHASIDAGPAYHPSRLGKTP